MDAIVSFLGWFSLIAICLVVFSGLTLIAIASFEELIDRIKNKLKK